MHPQTKTIKVCTQTNLPKGWKTPCLLSNKSSKREERNCLLSIVAESGGNENPSFFSSSSVSGLFKVQQDSSSATLKTLPNSNSLLRVWKPLVNTAAAAAGVALWWWRSTIAAGVCWCATTAAAPRLLRLQEACFPPATNWEQKLGRWIEGENLVAIETFGARKGHLSCCWSRKSTRCMAGAIARASHTKAVACTNTKSVVRSHRNARYPKEPAVITLLTVCVHMYIGLVAVLRKTRVPGVEWTDGSQVRSY